MSKVLSQNGNIANIANKVLFHPDNVLTVDFYRPEVNFYSHRDVNFEPW